MNRTDWKRPAARLLILALVFAAVSPRVWGWGEKGHVLTAMIAERHLTQGAKQGIHQLLVELNQRLGIAAIVVTHNPRLAERMPRRLRLAEGLVIEA